MIIVEQNLINLNEQVQVYRITESGAIIQTGNGTGDMTKAIYDPNAVGGDAFDMENMVEGATNKIFTVTERTKLSNNIDYANPITVDATPITFDYWKSYVLNDTSGLATLPSAVGQEGKQIAWRIDCAALLMIPVIGTYAGVTDWPFYAGETFTAESDGTKWIRRNDSPVHHAFENQLIGDQTGLTPSQYNIVNLNTPVDVVGAVISTNAFIPRRPAHWDFTARGAVGAVGGTLSRLIFAIYEDGAPGKLFGDVWPPNTTGSRATGADGMRVKAGSIYTLQIFATGTMSSVTIAGDTAYAGANLSGKEASPWL